MRDQLAGSGASLMTASPTMARAWLATRSLLLVSQNVGVFPFPACRYNGMPWSSLPSIDTAGFLTSVALLSQYSLFSVPTSIVTP